ncbi:MAG: DUF4105 domain-containing protein [Bdellovibrionota bacterium]|nr:DUF4105 domain-containing protein [Bdellovibrionota bacterium]
MGKLRVILLTICILSSIHAGAIEECKTYESDLFETGAVMPDGEYAGQCLDFSFRRNLAIVDEKDPRLEKYKMPEGVSLDDFFVVANFKHKSNYWLAFVPRKNNLVMDAIFQIEHFAPLAAHTQMRFDLADFIYLVGQNETNWGQEEKTSKVVISFESTQIHGESYGLIKGLQDKSALSAKFGSLEDTYEKIVIDQKHKNQQLKLSGDYSFKSKFFLALLIRGDKNKNQTEMYNTAKKNCTTEIFKVLDNLLGVKRHLWTRLNELLPTRADTVLTKRGLVEKEIDPLEIEFPTIVGTNGIWIRVYN